MSQVNNDTGNNTASILKQFKGYGVINKLCGSCLHYRFVGISHDSLLKSKITSDQAYGQCVVENKEVFSNELCEKFITLEGLPISITKNRKRPRQLHNNIQLTLL
jgi:hypothetical protein